MMTSYDFSKVPFDSSYCLLGTPLQASLPVIPQRAQEEAIDWVAS